MTTTADTVTGAVAAPEGGAGADGPGPRPRRRRAVHPAVYATAAYLAASLGVWWHVWTAQPTSVTTCGCGDSSLFQWFLAWPAHAIAHGQDPWYSTAMFHPHGVNLLANTAVVAVGTVLAPVTWLAGPIATFNVAQGLAPVLSALAMFLLVRRFVAWTPAAFCAGLLYGFSPFVLIALTDGHLMLSMAPMPPLMVLCLDELLARQRRNPVVVGLLLAVVVVVQFFVGTELLIMVGLCAAVGVVLVVVYLALRRREVLVRRTRHAAIGLGTAAVAAIAVLAYPTWFALAGPAHLSGPIWGPHNLISFGGTNVHDYLLPGATSAALLTQAHQFGGYQALVLSGQYFGIGLLAVLLVGLFVWRRDLRLWLFAAVGAFSVPLSMGLSVRHTWTLWSVFVHLPLMDNVIPSRFLLVTYLCAAVMLALILDHVRRAVDERVAGAPDDAPVGVLPPHGVIRRGAGTWAALAVALVAIVPIVGYYLDGLPFTTQRVVVPEWYRTVAPHLSGRQVLLSFPVPFDFRQSALTWQAVAGMTYDQAGGGGPGSTLARAGRERDGQVDLGDISISGGSPTVRPAFVDVTRQALNGWGVTMVVIPDTAGLPAYERVHAVRAAVVLITAATGQAPTRQASAWVWRGVQHGPPPVTPVASRLAACGAGPEQGSVASIQRSANCVLGDPRQATAT